MASITKRADQNGNITYTVRVRLKGHPIQVATFKRKTDAAKWASNTEAAIREGRHFKSAAAKKHTLGQAIDRYLQEILPVEFKSVEKANRLPILEWWKTELGYCVLADLDAATLCQSRNKLMGTGGSKGRPLAAATVRKYFVFLGDVLKRCVNEWKWLEKSPLNDSVSLPKLPPGVVRFLDEDELARLTESCKAARNPLIYSQFIIAISTGMRMAETRYLYWQEPKIPPTETAWGVVNLNSQCIVLHVTKNGDPRRLPLSSAALEELQKLAKVRRLDTALVFPSKTKPQQPIDLKRSWEYALKRADISNFRWHDLRHTTASYLAMNNAQLLDIAAILGHKSLSMVKRYAHLSDGHLADVVTSMSNSKLKNL